MALSKEEIRKKYKDLESFFTNEGGKHHCQCGCNELIVLRESHFWNGIPRYIFGHAARLRRGVIKYDKSKYYSVEDIAKLGNISDQTVRLWARKGLIKPVQTIGRKNLFDIQEIKKFLKTRPVREPFNVEDYTDVQQLKKKGVSWGKLRALVREGKISAPRLYARKTYYLNSEIEKFWSSLVKERKNHRVKRVSMTSFSELKKAVEMLAKRMDTLEKNLKSIATSDDLQAPGKDASLSDKKSSVEKTVRKDPEKKEKATQRKQQVKTTKTKKTAKKRSTSQSEEKKKKTSRKEDKQETSKKENKKEVSTKKEKREVSRKEEKKNTTA